MQGVKNNEYRLTMRTHHIVRNWQHSGPQPHSFIVP